MHASTAALEQATGPALWNYDGGANRVLFRAAASLGGAGQVTAARDACATLYCTALHHLGPDHPDTLTTRSNLAHCRGKAGDAAGAVAAHEELLDDRLRLLGPPTIPTPCPFVATWRTAGVRRRTPSARLRRSRGCWPTTCGCSAPTTPAP